MEDYNSNLLNDSKNEWSIRLMNVLSGHIIDGFRSIFNEALEICEQNEEPEKYLMTFQNFLSRIPKWSQTMIDTEANRIIQNSKCNYLEDLITCVHIVQLKILSCVRTSNHNKKIEIDIPNFTSFLHNVYINIARKLYSNIYLFQIDITSLEQQKNNREFELIVQTCIMNTIRDNIPIDHLLKQYIDETQEVDIEKKAKVINKEVLPETPVKDDTKVPEQPVLQTPVETVKTSMPTNEPVGITFNESVENYNSETKQISSSPLLSEEEKESYTESKDDSTLKIENEIVPIDIDDSLNETFTGQEKPIENGFKIIDDDNIQLNVESFDENNAENDIIDLGATELDI